MSKRAFGKYYYSMENSYHTKAEAQVVAQRFRATGKYYVRIDRARFGDKSFMGRAPHKWAVFVRNK